MEDEVAVAKDLVGEALVELLDLRDFCLPQEDSESLDLTCHRKVLICQVMCLALDNLALLCNISIDLCVGVNKGPEILTEGFC